MTHAPIGHHDESQRCLCSKHHQPAPLELNAHHIKPLEYGGPTAPENRIWLCPTAHVNVHEILRAMLHEAQVVAASGVPALDPERPLTYYDVNGDYSQPVSYYAYAVAWEGYRRTAGYPWRLIPTPWWANSTKRDGGHIQGQLAAFS